jgi:glutathione synthase/RimK-type ligase-like ATP-grasp enzyme
MIDRLAWVTARAARGRDDDEPPALAALAAAGVRVDVVDWDDPAVPWDAYDRAVLRSTWDYPERLAEFLAWLDRAGAAVDLRNPPAVVRWNVDKHHLAELAAAGLPVVPTAFVEPGGAPVLPDGELVVKPAVGAGSRDAASYGPDQRDAAAAHVARLHARGASAMVQPLLASVARDGEWPLVFLGGAYSHAASKRVTLPRAGLVDDLFAAERTGPHEPDPEQLAVAGAAVALVAERFGPPDYARIDLVRDDAGRPCVLEVELVEPSLFLPEGGPAAVARFVAAITA